MAIARAKTKTILNIPDEILVLIFQELEPVFLFSVLRVCQKFNSVARSNLVFTPLLMFYYPQTELPPEKERAEFSSHASFKKKYTDETHTLSRPARKLFDLVSFSDFPQIESTEFDPTVLFEKNNNEQYLLTYINDKNNQALRDLFFRKVLAWFERSAKLKAKEDWFANLFYDQYTLDDLFRYRASSFRLMDFAVALNQIDYVRKNASRLPSLQHNNARLTPFSSACFFGHLEIIRFLLIHRQGTPPLSEYYAKYEDPLSRAAQGNRLEVVQFLLATETEAITDQMIQSAAWHAVDDERLEVLALLLPPAPGQPVLVKSPPSAPIMMRNPFKLMSRACEGQPKAAKMIDAAFPQLAIDHDFTYQAAYSGSTELVRFFLEKNDNIEEYLQEHPGVLIQAAYSGSDELVSYLLSMHANPSAPVVVADVTPLHAAISVSSLSVVGLLVEAGANLHARDDKGRLPLERAKDQGDIDIVVYLQNALMRPYRKRKAEAPPAIDDRDARPSQRHRH